MASGNFSRYRPYMCDFVRKHMREGGSKKSAAAALRICSSTFYNYIDNYPEFKEAVNEAEEQSYKYWEDMGKKMAENGNASVWSLVMSNRFGWRSSNHPGDDDDGSLIVEIVEMKE